MSLSLELDDEQARRLAEMARRLQVEVQDLARAAINDLVSHSAEDFEHAVRRVLEKNRELYRRLA